MFHRIDDPLSMTAERFFSFAVRLTAYQGALRATLEQQQTEEQRYTSGSSEQRPDQVRHFRDINHNPELAQYFG